MQKLCLVAVDIRSTHNVGSLFRTADGFSVDLVLTCITPRPLENDDNRLPHVSIKADKNIAKTALGAEKNVSWRYFSDTKDAINTLKKEGYLIAAIEQAKKSKPITALKVTKPTALLLGPEVEGLSKNILDICDEIYEIPMTGKKESFNVSVSAGIAMYQARMKL
jgi:23S rRNA (guanosine2251-2'-O)-methyltransferase